MKATYRWLICIIAAALIVASGIQHHWDPFHKVLLALIVILALLNILLPILQHRMLQKIKAMPPEEREKFLARFDPKTQAKLRKQLEA